MGEQEGYPPGWLHATVHVNPRTGVVHRDGDPTVLGVMEWLLREDRCAPLVPGLRKIALWSAPNGRDAGFLEQRQFASAALRAHRERTGDA